MVIIVLAIFVIYNLYRLEKIDRTLIHIYSILKSLPISSTKEVDKFLKRIRDELKK